MTPAPIPFSAPKRTAIPLTCWGRDHFSTFAYAETCAVDHKGFLDKRRMRADPLNHPHLTHDGNRGKERCAPTRWFGWTKEMSPRYEVIGHDCWSCLEDAESLGFLTLDLETQQVVLTDLGHWLAKQLRAHKSCGGSFATFSIGATPERPPEPPPKPSLPLGEDAECEKAAADLTKLISTGTAQPVPWARAEVATLLSKGDHAVLQKALRVAELSKQDQQRHLDYKLGCQDLTLRAYANRDAARQKLLEAETACYLAKVQVSVDPAVESFLRAEDIRLQGLADHAERALGETQAVLEVFLKQLQGLK